MANDSYSPTYLVRSVHAIYHLDRQLLPINNEFNISYDSYDNDYTRSLIPVPVICMVLGLLAVIILQIALCSRMCCRCCNCLPDVANADGEISAADAERVLKPRFRWCLGLFIFVAILAILSDQNTVIGSLTMTKGVETGQDSLDYLYNMFTDLSNYGDVYYDDGNSIDDNLSTAVTTGCAQATTVQQYMPTYFEYVAEYRDYVDPVPSKCSDVKDGLQKWGIHYKNSSVWALYGVVLVGVAVYVVGLTFRSRRLLQAGIGVSQIIAFVIFIMVGVVMVLLMGLGDFCMDPNTYLPDLVPRDMYNVTLYYSSCTGADPLQPSIDALSEFTVDFTAALDGLSQACPGNVAVQACYPLVANINATLAATVSEVSCPPTLDQINDVLHSGLCEDLFQGIYMVWIGQYTSTSLVLICTILVSFAYQYFGTFWGDVDPNAPPPPGQNVLYVDAESGPAQARPVEPMVYHVASNSLHIDRPVADKPLA